MSDKTPIAATRSRFRRSAESGSSVSAVATQESVLTDDQIERIRIRAEKDSRRFGRTVDIPLRADLLLGLLSKLRPPVAGGSLAAQALKSAQSNIAAYRPPGSSNPESSQYDHDAFMWDYYQRAIDSLALASAPVAGEAKPSAFILAPIQQDHTLLVRYHFGQPPAAEAAPGASEAKQLDVPASSMLELFLSALPEIQATIRANHELRAALILARDSHGVSLLTDPPQDAWKARRVDEVIRAALAAGQGEGAGGGIC